MQLNELSPAAGSKKTKCRVGRGIGSGKGKTCGRGHKGQTARSGYSQKIGFEGGQMPIQRRVPKFGFTSLQKLTVQEVRLSEIDALKVDKIDLLELKAANIVKANTTHAKIILSGTINRAVHILGLSITKGARKAIEALGGKVEA